MTIGRRKPAATPKLLSPVAVVIPVFNRATVVLSTLASVARQHALPAHVVVVDDGSTDGSLEAVKRWSDSHRHGFQLTLIRQQHARAAAARNRGMREVADLPLVAFLDSDDIWPDDFLSRTISAMERDQHVVAATVDRKFINAHGVVFRRDDCGSLARDPISWMFRHGAGIASCSLFRMDSVVAAGGWNESLQSSEDTMLFSHVATLGPWAHVAGSPVEFHHGNAATRCEEGNSSLSLPDSFRQWARDFEVIYDSLAGRISERRRRRLRSSLAGYWYRAGKQLDRLGEQKAATDCYDRAIAWNPISLRSWRRRWIMNSRAA